MTEHLPTNFSDRQIGAYLLALSSGSPTPGGGSALGLTGSLGCSLGEMVCNLTRVRNDTTELAALTDRLAESSATLLSLGRRDEHVFAAYRAAIALPKSNDEEKIARRAAMQQALVSAAEVPLAMIETGLAALEDLRRAAEIGTSHALGDLMSGGYLIHAMILGSIENVESNAASMKNSDDRERYEEAARSAAERGATSMAALQNAVAARAN